MLIKKKSFQMETKAQYETLSNTNYASNYDEIFEYYNLELDEQILAINKLDIYSSG